MAASFEITPSDTENLYASFEAHTLLFKQPGGTSRGVLTEKKLWLIRLWSSENPSCVGLGECSVIPGLSPDFTSVAAYENRLREIIANPGEFLRNPTLLASEPSLLFGLETAFLDWKSGGQQLLFESDFTEKKAAIPINGLVWMGDEAFMQEQIDRKIADGFTCIKMKVGAIDFERETALLEKIRKNYPKEKMTLRVDANGAFTPSDVRSKLKRLADLEIHSIEQPLAPGQIDIMHDLCQKNILPIALDEELISVTKRKDKERLLQQIQPQFIILKPSLHGGFSGCLEWIHLAEKQCIGWWMTSALESNIGLNAIAQFTATFHPVLPQGLGTGGLYSTNFQAKCHIRDGSLYFG